MNNLIYLCLLSCGLFQLKKCTEVDVKEINNRQEKLFGIGIVRFENSVCMGVDGFEGTCYSRSQCHNVGGVSSGHCASGLGVCCIVQVTCGGTAAANNTYIVSPNYPQSYGGGTCSVIIKKVLPGVCQLRIDFLTLNLAQPNGNGSCINDALYILDGAAPLPVICGENSGQHVYVNFNGDSDIQILIQSNSAISTSRIWNIKVTQLTCDCPSRAPTGCLMYYTALSGTVSGFNYGADGPAIGTRQLANENYGVCIEMQPGYCGIQWSPSSGDPYSFTVSNDTQTATGMMTLGTISTSQTGINCTTDFVVIPNPVYPNGTTVGADRFCGNAFPNVITYSKPFVLTVVTDEDELMDVGNRGFSLTYTQIRCSGGMLG